MRKLISSKLNCLFWCLVPPVPGGHEARNSAIAPDTPINAHLQARDPQFTDLSLAMLGHDGREWPCLVFARFMTIYTPQLCICTHLPIVLNFAI